MSKFVYHVYALEPATHHRPTHHLDGIVVTDEMVISGDSYNRLKLKLAAMDPSVNVTRLCISSLTLLHKIKDA